MIGSMGWYLELLIKTNQCENLVRYLIRLDEVNAYFGVVEVLLSIGCVMHLKD